MNQRGNLPTKKRSLHQERSPTDSLNHYAAITKSYLGGMVDAIANKVAEILQFRQHELPQLPSAALAPVAVDPLEKYRRLQEVVDAGYLLSSSDLEVLLDRKALPAKDFDLYGSKFSKAGRNGGETASRVGKSSD